MKLLRSHGIYLNSMLWREQLQRLDQKLAQEFLNRFWNRWQDELDANLGECVLRQAPLAQIVGNSLHFFDGDRYSLLDFIVMPTHVHILASFPDEEGMLAQCESWKHYTAAQINRHLKQRGRFWQPDAFDHLVRSEAQFEYLRDYIAGNPNRARLQPGEYLHYSKSLTVRDEVGRPIQ